MKDTENDRTLALLSWLAGIAGGMLMAMILLIMMRMASYPLFTLSFWLILAAACGLPACMIPLEKAGMKRYSQLAAVGVSLGICLAYARTAGKNDATVTLLVQEVGILHAASLLVTVIRLFIADHKSGKEDSR
jgi:hypothetical protein